MKIDLDNLTIEQSKLFNEVALEIRQEFNDLIETISVKHSQNPVWLFSSIASRNCNLSPLFERCCKLALLVQLSESQAHLTEIATSDPELAQTLRLSKSFQHCNIECSSTAGNFLQKLLRLAKSYLNLCFYIASRFYGKLRNAGQEIPQNTGITLLDVYVLEGEKGPGRIENGKYNDRYYPGILKGFSEQEKHNVYYLAEFYGFINFSKVFNLIKNAEDNFIIPDVFLNISDYLFFLISPFVLILIPVQPVFFKKIDITDLVKSEKWQNSCNISSLLALLNFRFAMRLAKQGVKVRLLLKWYENQVNDRGMILGFRKHLPYVKVIGYQGFVVSEIPNIHSAPTPFEEKSLLTPNTIAVIGRKLISEPNKFGTNIDVTVAPAFRFQKLWEPGNITNNKDPYTILVGLPISINESCHILRLAADTIKTLNTDDIQILIKPHPTNTPDRLLKASNIELPEIFKFVGGDFNDHIIASDLLITNGSSICMEALAKGIQVVIIGNPNGFTDNPIPGSIPRNAWELCYTKDEVGESIVKFKKTYGIEDFAEKDILANKIKTDFFEPADTDKTKKILDMN